jgi:hypothetical protein
MAKKTSVYDEYRSLRDGGLSTEKALDSLVATRKVLLRGSVIDYPDGLLRATDPKDRNVYATNLASIALLNALFSKDGGPVLDYPFYIDESHPLVLKISKIRQDTPREKGFVYVITDRKGWFRVPPGSWQYYKPTETVRYECKIEVVRSDFTYPVRDMDAEKAAAG